jgi:hypothetical protein
MVIGVEFPPGPGFISSLHSEMGLGGDFTKKAIYLALARYCLFSLFTSANKFGLFPKKKANNWR